MSPLPTFITPRWNYAPHRRLSESCITIAAPLACQEWLLEPQNHGPRL